MIVLKVKKEQSQKGRKGEILKKKEILKEKFIRKKKRR